MYKILLVEDEKILRDAYAIMLDVQTGFTLDVASNGEEALKLCKENKYDLILLDLMMPILDGAGFLEKANLSKKSPHTRVVIMSNLSSGEGLEKVLRLGAHRHAVKSDLAPSDVVAIIDEELALVGKS
jgi:two-component system, response regulator YesN